jgi:hypothetical protein
MVAVSLPMTEVDLCQHRPASAFDLAVAASRGPMQWRIRNKPAARINAERIEISRV